METSITVGQQQCYSGQSHSILFLRKDPCVDKTFHYKWSCNSLVNLRRIFLDMRTSQGRGNFNRVQIWGYNNHFRRLEMIILPLKRNLLVLLPAAWLNTCTKRAVVSSAKGKQKNRSALRALGINYNLSRVERVEFAGEGYTGTPTTRCLRRMDFPNNVINRTNEEHKKAEKKTAQVLPNETFTETRKYQNKGKSNLTCGWTPLAPAGRGILADWRYGA